MEFIRYHIAKTWQEVQYSRCIEDARILGSPRDKKGLEHGGLSASGLAQGHKAGLMCITFANTWWMAVAMSETQMRVCSTCSTSM